MGVPGSADPGRPFHPPQVKPRLGRQVGTEKSEIYLVCGIRPGRRGRPPPSPLSGAGTPAGRSRLGALEPGISSSAAGGSELCSCSCFRRQVPWSRPRLPGVCVGCWGCERTLPHTCQAARESSGTPGVSAISQAGCGGPPPPSLLLSWLWEPRGCGRRVCFRPRTHSPPAWASASPPRGPGRRAPFAQRISLSCPAPASGAVGS